MLNQKFEFIKKVNDYFLYIGASREVALFIGCQFALESNFGQSRIALVQNNFCGMKSPVLRPSLNLNSARSFASFAGLKSCIIDYMLWLSWNKCSIAKLQDISAFKKFLVDKKYCPDPDYISSIERIFNEYSPLLLTNT